MYPLFVETFEITKNNMPGGWRVEKNSDLPFNAMKCDGTKMSLLSSGNKYIPVTPSVTDADLRMTVSFNFDMARQFEGIISFRYDLATRSGEAVRFMRRPDQSVVSLEYGVMADNRFTPKQSRSFEVPDEVLNRPVEISLNLAGERLTLEFAGVSAAFATKKQHSGKFAISRGHFFDLLNIHRFEIRTQAEPVPETQREFSVLLPREPTLYPVKCAVKLTDYGDCFDAELTFSGGVPETPIGEGNYHVMRADLLTNPFFKVLTAERMEKFILYEGRIVLVVEKLAPSYFYKVLHKKVAWPLHRTVRFMKPDSEYCMAVGVDEFFHTTAKTRAQRPSETIFDLNGHELYAGVGLTEKPQKVAFFSQADKAIIRELPKNDPRYAQAVEFAKNNHYFKEGENIEFTIEVASEKELPANFAITLENAYLEPLDTLNYRKSVRMEKIGVRSLSIASCVCSVLKKLEPGVYHLRCRSTDLSVSAMEDYCAFEVMSLKPDAPPPPIISGLPYLYNSRTETRGLETDSFDPWNGSSVDEGHYMSCANFLPKCAREYHVAPTVKTYRREWFLWLGTRCCDHPLIAENTDLVAEADYVNIYEELNARSLLWLSAYTGEILDAALEFAKQTGDPRFDLEKIADVRKRGKSLDEESFRVIAQDYWPPWLDFANERFHEKRKQFLARLRKINPKIKLSCYGPAHIYAAHYKGPEFVRVLLNAPVSPEEQGFWQYEDYPMACRYGVERGTYFLASALMVSPVKRIYPEIYTLGIQGCPDGAVFFAHPPFGIRLSNDPLRIKRRVYDYAFASAHYTKNGFRYWREYGFQACGFDRQRYEVLLKAWRVVRDYPPLRPMKCSAFVYSEESWRKNDQRTVLNSMHGIVDVRKIAGEAVPYAYEMARVHQALAGFIADMEALSGLSADQLDLLVLPPLAGVSPVYLDVIRALHAKGVNLLAFEDVTGLEDLFGVINTAKFRKVTHLKATDDFLNGMTEYCDEPLCEGKYDVAGADVLIDAEIPVLLMKKNRNAKAAFFNVPPTLVRNDQLHERLGYGQESISAMINAATGKVIKQLSGSAAETSTGRIIGFRAQNGADVVIVTNPDECDYITPVVRIRKDFPTRKLFSCDTPYCIMEEDDTMFRLRLKIEKEESAVIVCK